jgi:uncharacterized protein YecE (DUF72 family)
VLSVIYQFNMANYHIGCSGFHYKHWRDTFYPAKLPVKKWFDFYGQHFDTLELNVTFYRFPQVSMLEKWYNESPDHFRFAVKAPRVITHFKKFNNTERMLDDFYSTVKEGLQHKCGCCLFQLPPKFVYSEERLETILNSLHDDIRNVVEFRDESWWRNDVFKKLGEKKISFCGMSHPSLPKDIIHNTDFLYYRFHGEDSLYSSNYSSAQLNEFGNQLKNIKQIKEAFIFFNNDINTYAVYNATDLNKILSK